MAKAGVISADRRVKAAGDVINSGEVTVTDSDSEPPPASFTVTEVSPLLTAVTLKVLPVKATVVTAALAVTAV